LRIKWGEVQTQVVGTLIATGIVGALVLVQSHIAAWHIPETLRMLLLVPVRPIQVPLGLLAVGVVTLLFLLLRVRASQRRGQAPPRQVPLPPAVPLSELEVNIMRLFAAGDHPSVLTPGIPIALNAKRLLVDEALASLEKRKFIEVSSSWIHTDPPSAEITALGRRWLIENRFV
jgi:hypothetical protein